jgi:hypothetical protein
MELNDERKILFEAIGIIEKTYGLRLTLIEKLELKQYVAPVINARSMESHIRAPHSAFDSASEVISRFLSEYYGLPAEYTNLWVTRSHAPLYMGNPEKFKEYMRLLQEREHHEF